MNNENRTNNSFKNIKYALIGQFLGLIISFIARTYFIGVLGVEYLGLFGLINNILLILSLAELGIGTAISYSLYKPLSEKNIEKIQSIMLIFKRLYLVVGLLVLIVGLALLPFLPLIVGEKNEFSVNINIIYILILLNTVVTYFYSYKRSLLIADQNKYIDTINRYSFFIFVNLLQIIILIKTESIILFLLIQLIITVLENIVISFIVNIKYPFIKSKSINVLEEIERKQIKKNILALSAHKIGSIVVNGTDNILISLLVGLKSVGVYSNYLLILTALNTITGQIFTAITASVGNLVATESKEKTFQIFNSIFLLNFWIYSNFAIILWVIVNPFIELWLGIQFLLSESILFIIIVNFYMNGIRISTNVFKSSLGLFWNDRYKPIFEAGINLIASIYLGLNFGLIGIFIGTFLSNLFTNFWVEPYIIYKNGFKKNISHYFIKFFKYLLLMLSIAFTLKWISNYFNFGNNILLILFLLFTILYINFIYYLVFRKQDEFIYIKNLVMSKIKNV